MKKSTQGILTKGPTTLDTKLDPVVTPYRKHSDGNDQLLAELNPSELTFRPSTES